MTARRSATAPAAPHKRPQNCWRWGSVRTASAMTSALSPARVRSMITMPKSRAQNSRSEEHTSELQSLAYLVCRLLLEKKKKNTRLDRHVHFVFLTLQAL